MASSRPYANLFRKARTKGRGMLARVSTVAFQGVEDVPVEVQVMIEPGKVMMQNASPPSMRTIDANDDFALSCLLPKRSFEETTQLGPLRPNRSATI